MIHELVKWNDPILHKATDTFDFMIPQTDPIQLAYDLAETLIFNNGLGLAAPQIGLPYSVFAMMSEKIIVCYNPKIVDYSKEEIVLEEGCLSYPGIIVEVKRPKKIKVRYTEPNGNVVTQIYDGMTARVFQHEHDHLIGMTIKQRVSRLKWEQAKKKADKRK